MIFVLTNGHRQRQAPEDLSTLSRVELTAEEWADQQDLIRQLRKPWIRNANKNRNIRPARSASGYVLLSSQSARLKLYPGYRLTIETPYRLDAFNADAALQMIRADAARICRDFGYVEYVDLMPQSGRRPVLFDLQVVGDYDKSDYYRIKVLATAAPDLDRALDDPRAPQQSQGGFDGLSVEERIKRAQSGV